MAVNCAVCGASMVTAEKTTNKAGAAMSLHTDCATREEMLRYAQYWDPSVRNAINDEITRITKRRAGTPTIWP